MLHQGLNGWCVGVTWVLRRITIDSTRLRAAVTPFALSVKEVGLSAKVAPVPQAVRPFQAGRLGPHLRGLIERYTDWKNLRQRAKKSNK
jgi:hypothetical protein